jgi:hypothetical protein
VISIPTELLEQIERGNVLLFIGERIVRDCDGRPMIDGLTEQLAARCDTHIAADRSFPEVAQVYEAEKGRQALLQCMRDQLEERADQPHLSASTKRRRLAHHSPLITPSEEM